MFETPFYNQHIRNLVSVFGTLFNDIKVQRRDGSGKILETNKVPLSYGPKQKFIARLQGEPTLSDKGIALKLPRMAFELTSIDYDSTAKLNKQIRDAYAHPTYSYKRQYLRTYAPYNIGFQLSILVKNMDEGLQIVEQILPLFQPDYTVTIIENNNVNRKTDIPFVLTSVDLSEDYEGDFESRRSIIYTLDFTTKLRFFQGIQESGVIKHVDANITDTTRTPQILLETINVDVDPAAAEKDDTQVSASTTPGTDEYRILQTTDFFVEH
jgi:hypothetical protein